MTRAERRRLERENLALDKAVVITQRNLNELINERAKILAKKYTQEHILPDVLLVFGRVMADKFGFGKIRWNRMFKGCSVE
jgi:hypothetical protein